MSEIGGFILGVVVFVVLVVAGAIHQEKSICKSYERIGGYEVKYEMYTGCWVKMPQGWIRTDDNKTQKK
jgi:hypothetical protein